MNHHELLDVATVSLAALALRDRAFFARSLDGPPVDEAAAGADAGVDAVGTTGVREVTVTTPVGEYDAAYLAYRWRGDDAPTVVFHHGSGENPFDFGRFSSNSVRRLFGTGDWAEPVNLVAVRAPFHDRSGTAYARSMGHLADFVGMVAASTALVEDVTAALQAAGSPGVVVSGISLGGWVATLHRAVHGTADHYVPVFAGAALGELFATSSYRKMTGDLAREDPDRLREVLDFEAAFAADPTADCTGVLGRYDRVVEFDAQRGCYDDLELAVLEKGHVTGSLATGALREQVRRGVDRATGET